MSKIVIEIERLLAERGISKTQLCYMCKLQRTQLNRYCKNKVARVDLHTLEKICDFLKCDINDILILKQEEPVSENEKGNEIKQ